MSADETGSDATFNRALAAFSGGDGNLGPRLPELVIFMMREAAQFRDMPGRARKAFVVGLVDRLINHYVQQDALGPEYLILNQFVPGLVDLFASLESGKELINKLFGSKGCLASCLPRKKKALEKLPDADAAFDRALKEFYPADATRLPEMVIFLMREAAQFRDLPGPLRKEFVVNLVDRVIRHHVDQEALGPEFLILNQFVPGLVDLFASLESGKELINKLFSHKCLGSLCRRKK